MRKRNNHKIINNKNNSLKTSTSMKKEKAKKFFVDFDKEMGKDEALLAVFNKSNGKVCQTTIVTPNTIERQAQMAGVLARHIYDGLNGEGDECDKALADILTFAVKTALKWQGEGFEEEYDEGEDYKEEECADCPDMRTCNEKKAIAYRKKHHIPKPKKKSNKK